MVAAHHHPLWTPSPERIAKANLTLFIRGIEENIGVSLPDYNALYHWSISEPEEFWRALWSFSGIIATRQGNTVLVDNNGMTGAKWFPEARLNFAENLLRRRDSNPAIIFWNERRMRRSLSYGELYNQVSMVTQALANEGIRAGDRVGGFIPNLPEAIIAMLATTSLGAVWSSCSPDFGINGAMDRFGQIEPKVLFSTDGYFYNGKIIDSLERASGIVQKLSGHPKLIVIPYVRDNPLISDTANITLWRDFISPFTPEEINFPQLPFDHPIYILYSSGTTGVPKCIVHGAGGTLLQHYKEHQLLTDVMPGDRVFYFTTCGWMMWNWLVSSLASQATVMLYDGAPFHPDGNTLFDFAATEKFTVFGTSPKFLDAAEKSGLKPIFTHDFKDLRTILSTGSPLHPQSFDYVYRDIKTDVCLSSISGGTDIISCFAGGNPIGPVWRGELQARALGMRVRVFDKRGNEIQGEKGELVCTRPFPSMPIAFWNDPRRVKYREAYFNVFPDVWYHGDYVELTEHGGMIIYGRSDAILNPGGVRIGTAEIYRQVEQLEEILESLVIGQEWKGDTRIVLFVRLRDGLKLSSSLRERINHQIRINTTPRHVPSKILQVADIPRTISGKIVELAVSNTVHGRPVRNIDALSNPESLDLFKDREELTN